MLDYKEISCIEMSLVAMCMLHWMYGNAKKDNVINEYILINVGIEAKIRENHLYRFSLYDIDLWMQ